MVWPFSTKKSKLAEYEEVAKQVKEDVKDVTSAIPFGKPSKEIKSCN